MAIPEPEMNLDLDLLIQSMSSIIKLLNQDATIDERTQLINRHMMQAKETVTKNTGNNQENNSPDMEQYMEDTSEIELSMTLAMQFYLGYFEENSLEKDTRHGRLISLAGKNLDLLLTSKIDNNDNEEL